MIGCHDAIRMADENPIPHLWAVITEPESDRRCVIISITTLRNNVDQTVILQPGEHPFIRKPSAVYYQRALIADAGQIDAAVRRGQAALHAKFSQHTIRVIQEGVMASPYTPDFVIVFCRRAWPECARTDCGQPCPA